MTRKGHKQDVTGNRLAREREATGGGGDAPVGEENLFGTVREVLLLLPVAVCVCERECVREREGGREGGRKGGREGGRKGENLKEIERERETETERERGGGEGDGERARGCQERERD